jgi:hypothetical protein
MLADIYLTVLYARGGKGIFSRRIGAGTWRIFRLFAGRCGTEREAVLTFAGPTMLVILAAFWVGGIICGFALITWPMLGSSIQTMQGKTLTDFMTAVSYTGGNATTAGGADVRPVTSLGRWVTLIDSLVGISSITLVLTYFLQIYRALQGRNAFSLQLHHATDATGDAAQWLAGLGPGGDFTDGRRVLAAVAGELAKVYEAHHFYGALVLFRFREPYYAFPRMALVVMDAITLVRTALPDEKYGGITKSGAASALWLGGMQMLDELSQVFLPPVGAPNAGKPPDQKTTDRWRKRYSAGLLVLRNAGIATIADERAGAEQYVSLRSCWDGYVQAFASYLAHTMSEVDAAGSAVA